VQLVVTDCPNGSVTLNWSVPEAVFDCAAGLFVQVTAGTFVATHITVTLTVPAPGVVMDAVHDLRVPDDAHV
jgi:hypothetical protein